MAAKKKAEKEWTKTPPKSHKETKAGKDLTYLGHDKVFLPCVLTDEQMIRYARRVGKLLSDIEAKEAEKKAQMEEFKAELTKLETEQRQLLHALDNGSEDRHIIVHHHYHGNKTDEISTWRTDTGEEVAEERRRPAKGELQDDFRFPDPFDGDDTKRRPYWMSQEQFDKEVLADDSNTDPEVDEVDGDPCTDSADNPVGAPVPSKLP